MENQKMVKKYGSINRSKIGQTDIQRAAMGFQVWKS
jgi:hypothetical protein